MKWLCINCGYIEDINLFGFEENKIKTNIGIKHIYPICNKCNSIVKIDYINEEIYEILVFNGSCGSGKSSISKLFYCSNDQFIVDGDCVIEIIKNRFGERKEYNSVEVYDEIIEEIKIGIMLKKKIILNHIFSKDEFLIFKNKLIEYKIKPMMILLRPSKEVAFNRTQERMTFKNKTEKKWVDHFCDIMMEFNENDSIIIDNSNYSIEETIKTIKEKINN